MNPNMVGRWVRESSTYYYRVNQRNTQRKVRGGRPIPGYSYTKQQNIVSDDQIKEWLLQFIENECFAYGYVKLTVALRKTYGLVINKKKVNSGVESRASVSLYP